MDFCQEVIYCFGLNGVFYIVYKIIKKKKVFKVIQEIVVIFLSDLEEWNLLMMERGKGMFYVERKEF